MHDDNVLANVASNAVLFLELKGVMEGANPSVDTKLWHEINNAVERAIVRKEFMRASAGNGTRSHD